MNWIQKYMILAKKNCKYSTCDHGTINYKTAKLGGFVVYTW